MCSYRANMPSSTCNPKTEVPDSKKPPNFKLYARVSIFCIAIVGVCVLFTVPVIVYNTRPQFENNLKEGYNWSQSRSNSHAFPNHSIPIANCSAQFSFNENKGICTPICSQWKGFSQEQVVAFTVTTILSHVCHIIGTVVALLFSFYNYKLMFKFPAILLLYYIVSPIILDIVFFITFFGREHLLCSSSDLIEAREHSTPFCYFSGMITTFIFTSLGYWWLFLTIMIFWKVWFPNSAKNVEVNGYMKYIHIAIVVTSLVLSLLPVVAALGTGGFVISSFPVYLNFCYPRNLDVLFNAFILPLCINQPAGCTFNLLTLYKVLSLKQHLLKKGSSNLRAECRLLVFLLYFAFAVALNLMLFTVGLRSVSQNEEGLTDYFKCEALGSNSNDPCILEVDLYRDHALAITAFVVHTFSSPYVTLVYVVPVDKVKTQWRKLSSQQCSCVIDSPMATASTNMQLTI